MKPEDFCALDDIRPVVQRPFTLDGYTVATNGWALLISPASNYMTAEEAGVRETTMQVIKTIIAEIKNKSAEFASVPLNLPEMVECKTCKGSGKPISKKCPECSGVGLVFFENYHHDYEIECQSCDGVGSTSTANIDGNCINCAGTGKQYEEDCTVEIFDMKFNPNLVELFINAPNLQLAPNHEAFRICFKSGDQFGALMALRS